MGVISVDISNPNHILNPLNPASPLNPINLEASQHSVANGPVADGGVAAVVILGVFVSLLITAVVMVIRGK